MMTRLSATQTSILLAMAGGSFLKSHRYLDGTKAYRLHPLHGPALTVRRATVEALTERGLIDSNKKFPSATYWLTERGRAVVAGLRPEGA